MLVFNVYVWTIAGPYLQKAERTSRANGEKAKLAVLAVGQHSAGWNGAISFLQGCGPLLPGPPPKDPKSERASERRRERTNEEKLWKEFLLASISHTLEQRCIPGRFYGPEEQTNEGTNEAAKRLREPEIARGSYQGQKDGKGLKVERLELLACKQPCAMRDEERRRTRERWNDESIQAFNVLG